MILFLSACAAHDPIPYDGEQVIPVPFPTPGTSSSVAPFAPVTMKTFRSTSMGVSFSYPDLIPWPSDCEGKNPQSPTEVFEDPSEGFIALSTAKYILPYVMTCTESGNSLQRMQELARSYPTPWMMDVVEGIASNDALLAHVRDSYGEKCIFEDAGVSDDRSLIDFRVIRPPDMAPFDDSCPVHWTVIVKYSLSLKKAIILNLGQEPTFWKNPENTESFDAEILKSIRLF